MVNSPIKSTDVRLLLPEVIWLEPEHFKQAIDIKNQVTGEAHQWQTYLNALALFSFEEWLKERISERKINRDINLVEAVFHLKVGEFKLCLIASENLLDEVVSVPENVISKPELAAHFYVVLEVLEEQEEVIVRGFLPWERLINDLPRQNLPPLQDGCYQLPLSVFDPEPNHLLFSCRYLEASAISLPEASAKSSATQSPTEGEQKLGRYVKESKTKLSQWLEGVFESGWQTIDALINPELNLALSTRNISDGAKGGKLINLGIQLDSKTVALLLTIIPDAQKKLGIVVQLFPTGEEKYLPSNLKLTLLSKLGKKLQETQSREGDNYIQLKPFKGQPGKCFSIEISMGDVTVREDFEL